MEVPEGAALIVIDVQRGFDEVAAQRNNPAAESNIAALLAAWRARRYPIVFVRHDSVEPASMLRPGRPGNEFKEVVSGRPDLLVSKSVNSAFYGKPDLHAWLRERGIGALVLCGIQTNFCVETTARMAGNLGYDTYVALDATHTFDMEGFDGELVTADELARITATNLHGEFATVLSTRDLIG